jgi:hypothetical protein
MPVLKPNQYPDDEDLLAGDGQDTRYNNSSENERANNAAKAAGLTREEEEKFHDAITGKPPMTYQELEEIAKDIKNS